MRCELRIRGHLDDGRSAWFGGLAIERLANGDTRISGDLPDQAALHGALARIRDLGLPLLEVTCDDERPVAWGEE